MDNEKIAKELVAVAKELTALEDWGDEVRMFDVRLEKLISDVGRNYPEMRNAKRVLEKARRDFQKEIIKQWPDEEWEF